MRVGQIVARYSHEEMVLAVEINPVRRHRGTFYQTSICGAGVGERVIAARCRAGMFGDVPDAEE